ncbi:STAS/SEC14 domain-containing protein [Polaromonas sp.]|uniref:STAS/SEC14 domain-containing protein n=1 Tax=Polaromonas sp. TaxID=1869339 RepID=UPI003263E63B
MGVDFSVEQRSGYAVVRVGGDPSLEEFLGFVEVLAEQSRGWEGGRALCDLRKVRTLKSFTEHYAVGEAVGRHLRHLRQVASVVAADRITHTSEKTARNAGVNLMVFTSEDEAIKWLTTPA